MHHELELTILMPCLNEAETLGICIQKAKAYLQDHGVAGEILVADNGSTDGSQSIARAAGARVVDVATKGYGSALQGGIRAARGRYVIMGDADDSYDFTQLAPFVEKLRAGSDLVMGNRFKGGIDRGAMPMLHRYLGNPVLSFLGRLFFNIPINDFHCGLRGFDRAKMLETLPTSTGMEFASEMIIKAAFHGITISEVPTRLSPDGRSRPPHLRTWRDGWRHLRLLLAYSPTWLFFYPGLLFILVGLTMSIFLIQGPLVFSEFTLGVHTLLYAATSVYIGVQLVSFYLLARVYGAKHHILPVSAVSQWYDRWFTLETSLLLGLGLVVTGLGLSVASYDFWRNTGYGDLDPAQSLRLVIPAVWCLILGIQLIFTGFFKSLLALR